MSGAISEMATKSISRKTGRRLLSGIREPNGRLTRRVLDQIGGGGHPSEIARAVEAMISKFRDPVYGTPLGRLFLAKELDAEQFTAGKRWGALIDAYHRATDAPMPNPKSISIGTIGGGKVMIDPDTEAGQEQAKNDRAIVNACHEAHVIISVHGIMAERDMRALCEGVGQSPVGYESLLRIKKVLSGLAKFWGLDKP